MEGLSINPPELFRSDHDCSAFDCGEETLNEWLKRRALRNQSSGASRTFVATSRNKVVGFYGLATGAVAHSEAIRSLGRNMPNPIPVILLARLAVDRLHAGQGLGADLLRDALMRTVQVSDTAGVAALLVHAKSEQAAGFYKKYGFRASPVSETMLMLSLRDIKASL